MMDHDLKDQVAFVTGATSGLGRHFAMLLAQHGARVALAGRRKELLAEVAQSIRKAGGVGQPIVLDVTDVAGIPEAIDDAERELGPISILVNNAGMSVLGLATEISAQGFDAVMQTNVRGPFLLATEVARRMILAKREGRIINVASIGSFRVLPGLTTYCTSKAALAMMTQCLAREWARHGINVNALCPGYIETELNAPWFESERGRAQINSFPRRRLANAADLDGMFLLLASDRSRAITGSLLTVDDAQSL
jgi:NAD(P)-dependent dehydrogenase (short-subunit alcohol dehydrogenase family)